MKKFSAFPNVIYHIIIVAGSLIKQLPKCEAAYGYYLTGQVDSGPVASNNCSSTGNVFIRRRPTPGRRSLTSVAEMAQAELQHSLYWDVVCLPQSCVECMMKLALIQETSACSTTDAYESAVMYSPDEKLLSYSTDEEGSSEGWKSKTFSLWDAIQSTNSNSSTSTLPDVSLTDVLDPNIQTDYVVAVYFYDTDINPVACATLQRASEEDAELYEKLFYGLSAEAEEEGAGGETYDTNDVMEASKTVGTDTTSSGGVALVSAFLVIGVSFAMSAAISTTSTWVKLNRR